MENGWEAFVTLARFFGIPGAMALALLYAYHKGWFITGREDIARQKTIDAREAEWVKRWEELTKEKDMWRGAFLDSVKVAERAVRTAEVTAERLPLKKDGVST